MREWGYHNPNPRSTCIDGIEYVTTPTPTTTTGVTEEAFGAAKFDSKWRKMAAGSVQEFYSNRANEPEEISDQECLRRVHLYFVINKGKERIKSAMASKSNGMNAQAARDALLKEAGVDVAWAKGWN